MATILKGTVLWCYDYEIVQRVVANDISYQFSGINPFHTHKGIINLNDKYLSISGDIDINLPLSHITQLFLGFDENYTPLLAKNLGVFWQPLRLTTYTNSIVYLIVDYNLLFSKNKKWYNTLQQILSA